MVAHMNAEALARTLDTGEAWYWSRSRSELWHKGATSGQIQSVVEMRVDCDQDALWLKVTSPETEAAATRGGIPVSTGRSRRTAPSKGGIRLKDQFGNKHRTLAHRVTTWPFARCS